VRNQGGGANSPVAVLGEIPVLHGSGRGGRAWGASWHRGEAEAGLGRGWGVAERWVHGGARGAARRSKAGDGVGARWRLRCGVIEPREVRGG
jgi:hypothetical protein